MATFGERPTDDFEYTATGVLGDKRRPMLENELHLRSELGKPVKHAYVNTPGPHATYGRPSGLKDGGAAEALRGWPVSFSIPYHGKGTKEITVCRDFVELNKAAVVSGLTTAPENYQFRATHDAKRFMRDLRPVPQASKYTRKLPVTTVFGIPTRPSTPIHEVIEHRFQDKWIEERRQMEIIKKREEAKTKPRAGDTRTSILRTYQVPVDPSPLWRMPKFSKHACPHLATFQSDKIKESAYRNHASDSVSRKGVIGQGIYVPAQT